MNAQAAINCHARLIAKLARERNLIVTGDILDLRAKYKEPHPPLGTSDAYLPDPLLLERFQELRLCSVDSSLCLVLELLCKFL